MDLVSLLPTFVVAVVLISASPGPAMALILLAGCAGRARGWFARPTVRGRWEVISGSVLIGLGVRVAATSR